MVIRKWRPCQRMPVSISTTARVVELCSNLNRVIAVFIAHMQPFLAHQFRPEQIAVPNQYWHEPFVQFSTSLSVARGESGTEPIVHQIPVIHASTWHG